MLRIVTSLFVASALAAQDLGKDAWEVVAPQLSKHCYPCHGEGKELEGDLDLKARPFLGDRARTVAVLREMRGLVTKGEMPPEDADSIPTREERAAIVAWVDDRLREIVAKGGLDPGRVTMRKISRAEYANAIRDLFGVRGEVTKGFPADDLGYGFDNIGAASTFSVLHFEKYLVAAERIAARALGLGDQKTTQRKEAETLDVSRANVSVPLRSSQSAIANMPASRENGSDCSQTRPGPVRRTKNSPSPPKSTDLIPPACTMS